jgi:predicted small secreted protein
MFIIYLVSALLLIAAALIIYHFIKRKGSRERILEAYQRIAATMNIEGARIQGLPSFTLSGDYRTFHLIFECEIKRVNGTRSQAWRISLESKGKFSGKMYIQSESMEAKLRKVVDLKLATTKDAMFDSKILVFASDDSCARRVFNPYLRFRFLFAGFKDFTLNVAENRAVLETFLPLDAPISIVRHQVEVLTEFLNLLGTV